MFNSKRRERFFIITPNCNIIMTTKYSPPLCKSEQYHLQKMRMMRNLPLKGRSSMPSPHLILAVPGFRPCTSLCRQLTCSHRRKPEHYNSINICLHISTPKEVPCTPSRKLLQEDRVKICLLPARIPADSLRNYTDSLMIFGPPK